MCGIAGFWTTPLLPEQAEAELCAMADTLVHRGPDCGGVHYEPEVGLGLAHRRLSILDLSPLGAQPMVSPGGRFVVVFNGEIYNHRELRKELSAEGCEPARFRGDSDTATLVAALEHWGVEATVRRLNGMFAFAAWDRHHRRLFLGRDRLGIKPLYFGWLGGRFRFGSELKALLAGDGHRPEISRGALALYMRFGYVPAPHSIYEGIEKLPAGGLLTIQSAARGDWALLRYWSVEDAARSGIESPFEGNELEATDALDALLRDAVRSQMISDVPLGAFLSGGIDSSTVVALMQAQSDRPVRTFTIGSEDARYDEASHARAVAQHLGTEHTELYVSADEAQAVIPSLPAMYDEPFADYSQIPTHLVSRLARQHVKVTLSGDGGDELFAGYNRHVWAPRIWDRLRCVPQAARALASRALLKVPPDALDSACGLGARIGLRTDHRTPGLKLHKLAEVMASSSPEALYVGLQSIWKAPTELVLGSSEPHYGISTGRTVFRDPQSAEPMMLGDMMLYLPDDILTKVDRASMACSLEARVPLLDHRVVEFAWSVPLHMKLRDGKGKWLLREVLRRYVPTKLIDRPKAGFTVPLDTWLRGPLRDWAEACLSTKRVRDEGYLDVRAVRSCWEAHLSGKRQAEQKIWNVLMFQTWLDAQNGSDTPRIPSHFS